MKRKHLIVANWKMHKTHLDIEDFAEQFSSQSFNSQVGIAIPFPYLSLGRSLFSNINIGAQTCSNQQEGAFTGQVSASMIHDCGASFVIIGHSERRAYLHEAEPLLTEQIDQATEAGLEVIYCVGEKEETADFNAIASKQLEPLKGRDFSKISVAYEPVWAIGTGKACNAERAERAHFTIRETLSQLYNADEADRVRIIYGGSVSAENIGEYAKKELIDGALVGGASLDPSKFSQIIGNFEQKRS